MTGDATAPATTEAQTPRLIVGLGNPGPEYRNTRHNAGFMVLDELAGRMGASFAEESRFHGLVAKFSGGWLLKPRTFMNDSGRSVAALARFHKISPAETLVVHDEVDLALGALKFRQSGSAAGHNGIKSLIQHLGTQAFPRLKVGIGSATGRPAGERLAGHVLGGFRPEEWVEMQISIQRAADAVMRALHSGLAAAMNLFNQKPSTPQTPQ
ncbi:MAG TPA: aminoacyl-tRNA hydrolase [Prosthecobacter sp.]|nr:aminoacyl-tRNA hydrolase [Prosthecobacter sp.]HRK16780.1 aminoacyl-tRNA hydrolase [Prosthecobacter sp.]